MDKTTVAKALASLEGKGHITRRPNPENRRKNILFITEAGEEKIALVVHIYDDWLAQVFQTLSDEEQVQFQSYCQRLLERAEQVNKGAD
jgi:DNA-binding MarR family transcriptional regulator